MKEYLVSIFFIVSSQTALKGAIAFSPTLSTWTVQKSFAAFLDNDKLHFLREKNSLSMQMSSGGGNFYDDFGDGDFLGDDEDEDDDDLDDDEDEDDDDEYANLEVGDFRSRLGSIMGEEPEKENAEVDELISFATSATSTPTQEPVTDWAKPFTISSSMDQLGSVLTPGTILIANPSKFCSDFETSYGNVSPALLSKFGLTLPPPATLGPDRRADLLPVLVILERHPLKGCQAVLLNRRTGYLIGDLEQEQPPTAPLPSDFDGKKDVSKTPTSSGDTNGGGQRLWAFMIQPLWFGGTSAGDSGGLDMLHPCSMIPESKSLTDDGLFWGGDPGEAQRIMERGDVNVIINGEYDEETGDERKRLLSGFDFKFFVQRTRWLPTQLEKEIRDGTWYAANVSKEVLFKSRDRLGTKRAKPLWTEIMELMGGEYKDVRDTFYEEE